jgi:hypothetical protein
MDRWTEKLRQSEGEKRGVAGVMRSITKAADLCAPRNLAWRVGGGEARARDLLEITEACAEFTRPFRMHPRQKFWPLLLDLQHWKVYGLSTPHPEPGRRNLRGSTARTQGKCWRASALDTSTEARIDHCEFPSTNLNLEPEAMHAHPNLHRLLEHVQPGPTCQSVIQSISHTGQCYNPLRMSQAQRDGAEFPCPAP